MRSRRTIKDVAAVQAVCAGLIAGASLTLACGGGGSSFAPMEDIAAPTVIALSDVVLKEPVVRPTAVAYEAGPVGIFSDPSQSFVATAVSSRQPAEGFMQSQAPASVQPGSIQASGSQLGLPPSSRQDSVPPTSPPPLQNQVSSSSWAASASVLKPIISAGATQTFAVLVDNSKSTSAVVDIEVFDRTGKRVHQAAMPNLFLAAGTHRFNPSWAIPKETPPGTYTVSVGIFEPNWTKLIIWKDALATFDIIPR